MFSEIDSPPEFDLAAAPFDDVSAVDVKADALSVLGRLRNAVGLAIHATTNKGLHNSRDLQNELGVDRNLSWQIFKMLGPVDTLSILPYVPAPVSMKKLLTIMKKRGVPQSRIVEAEAAFNAFEAFVRTSASDRDRLETMLMSFTDSDEGRQVDLSHRKAAFRAHSHFYGTEVDTAVQTLIYFPGTTAGTVSCVGMQQVTGMRRLRLDTEIVVTRMNMTDTSGDHRVMAASMVDEAAAERYGAPVIADFCSRPMPELSTIVDSAGLSRTILMSQRMGSAADIDLAFGRAWLDMPKSVNERGQHTLSAVIACIRPTQLVIGDIFVHRATFPNIEKCCGNWGQVGSASSAAEMKQQGIRLPMREAFEYIGSGEDMARIRELPRYTELLALASARFGFRLDEMDLYRLRIRYPLVDSRIVLEVCSNQPAPSPADA